MPENTSDYNDRGLTEPTEGALPKPQIEIIVDGNSVLKPGMRTYFVGDYDAEGTEYNGQVVGTYCSCDRRVCIRTCRRYGMSYEGRVVTAAVLSMEYECEVKNTRLKFSELSVRTDQMQDILCSAVLGYR